MSGNQIHEPMMFHGPACYEHGGQIHIARTLSRIALARARFLSASSLDLNEKPSSGREGFGGGSCRERKEECRALFYFRLRPNASAMALDNAVNDGQADARAFEFLFAM